MAVVGEATGSWIADAAAMMTAQMNKVKDFMVDSRVGQLLDDDDDIGLQK